MSTNDLRGLAGRVSAHFIISIVALCLSGAAFADRLVWYDADDHKIYSGDPDGSDVVELVSLPAESSVLRFSYDHVSRRVWCYESNHPQPLRLRHVALEGGAVEDVPLGASGDTASGLAVEGESGKLFRVVSGASTLELVRTSLDLTAPQVIDSGDGLEAIAASASADATC